MRAKLSYIFRQWRSTSTSITSLLRVWCLLILFRVYDYLADTFNHWYSSSLTFVASGFLAIIFISLLRICQITGVAINTTAWRSLDNSRFYKTFDCRFISLSVLKNFTIRAPVPPGSLFLRISGLPLHSPLSYCVLLTEVLSLPPDSYLNYQTFGFASPLPVTARAASTQPVLIISR